MEESSRFPSRENTSELAETFNEKCGKEKKQM